MIISLKVKKDIDRFRKREVVKIDKPLRLTQIYMINNQSQPQ